jgi:hypothetical protein
MASFPEALEIGFFCIGVFVTVLFFALTVLNIVEELLYEQRKAKHEKEKVQ